MKETKRQPKAEKKTVVNIKKVDAEAKLSEDDNQDDLELKDLNTNESELGAMTTSQFLLPPLEVISRAKNSKVLILVLVGLPGCGKSTLADRVKSNESDKQKKWEVVNQDVLKARYSAS